MGPIRFRLEREKKHQTFIVHLCTRKQSSRAFWFFYYELFYYYTDIGGSWHWCATFVFFPRDMKDISKENVQMCARVLKFKFSAEVLTKLIFDTCGRWWITSRGIITSNPSNQMLFIVNWVTGHILRRPLISFLIPILLLNNAVHVYIIGYYTHFNWLSWPTLSLCV
jgi:hypothetical protein